MEEILGFNLAVSVSSESQLTSGPRLRAVECTTGSEIYMPASLHTIIRVGRGLSDTEPVLFRGLENERLVLRRNSD